MFSDYFKINMKDTEVNKGIGNLKEELKENKKYITVFICIDIIISIFISGFVVQWFQDFFNDDKSIYLAQIIPCGLFTWYGFLFSLSIFLFFAYVSFNFYRSTRKDYVVDEENNRQISKQGIYGTAHWQTEKEKEECFFRSKDPMELEHYLDILGIDNKGYLYALRDDLVGLNRNMAVIGAPGAGKSAALVKNQIYQNILRGDSCIVTDSKGDLYKECSSIARKHGYKTRILNLKSGELKNSDACHFLKFLNGDPVKAEVMSNAIIANTGDGHMDYWANNEMNCLKAVLLYVSTNETLIKTNRNNLAEVYNIVTTNDSAGLADLFSMLEDDDPAKLAFNIFANCDPKVQGQILNGMGIRLSVLGSKEVKQIVSNDEIDLVEPMKQKCMYFVVISDTDTSFKFIATLFFTLMFIQQCEYSDALTPKAKKKQLPVNYILDEFANTGAIPDFEKKVTTVRSRKIGITIILQDIGQLEFMYPNKVWNTILNGMVVKMLLSTNDPNTAKYFETLLGELTVRVENRRYDEGAGDIIHAHSGYNVGEGLGKAFLMKQEQFLSMSSNDLVIVISGHYPVKLHKYICDNHPMDAECVIRMPGRHKPLWRKKIEDEIEKEKINDDTNIAQETKPNISEETQNSTIQKKDKEKPKENLKAAELIDDDIMNTITPNKKMNRINKATQNVLDKFNFEEVDL